MKKTWLSALGAGLLLLGSCEKDETIQNEVVVIENGPALEVKATPLFENQVLIDWGVLKELEGASVVYDVTVNTQKLGDKVTASNLTIDGNQFKGDGKSEIILDITIVAFGSGDEEQKQLLSYETTEVVILNNAPKAFEITNFFANQQGLIAMFTAPVDLDSDQITFDFSLNGEVVAEDIFFNTNSSVQRVVIDDFGRPIFPFEGTTDVVRVTQILNEFVIPFSEQLLIEPSEDVVLAITAKDGRGGETSVERTFNIDGSDVQLGVLENTSITEISYDLSDEVDNGISYFFTVNQTTGVRIGYQNDSLGSFFSFSLREEDGSLVFFSGENSGFIDAGNYEVRFSSGTFGESLVLETFEANSQDKDLGLVSLPFQSTETIEFFRELDRSFEYTFEIDQESDYRFEIINGFSFDFSIIEQETGVTIASAFSDNIIESRFRGKLPEGNYVLRISRDSFNSSFETFELELIIEGLPTTAIENLGKLTLPFQNEYDLNLQQNLLTNSLIQVFDFEIDQSASYFIATDQLADFVIRDEFGSRVRSNSSVRIFQSFGRDLQRGKYTLEILNANSSSQPTRANISISDDFTAEISNTIDLGVVSVPFETNENFNFSQELSNKLSYTFEVAEDASYRIGTGLDNTRIRLYRNFPNFENQVDSGNRGIINQNEFALTPGSYRLEIEDLGFGGAAVGELFIAIE